MRRSKSAKTTQSTTAHVNDQSITIQSHKLISHACENKRVLFEPRQENFPYHLKIAVRMYAAPVMEIESYLQEILTASIENNHEEASSPDGSNYSNSPLSRRDLVGESHRKFLRSAEKLRKNSNSVNESLCFVISTYDKNNSAAETVMNQHIELQQRGSVHTEDSGNETFETY